MSLLDTASLIVTPNGYKEGKLYSVIPSDGSGDLSVTRATTATRVNSAGLVELVPYNLLQQSNSFNGSPWAAVATRTPNAAIAPDGTMTATRIQLASGGIGYLYQGVPASSGAKTISCYIKGATAQTIGFNDGNANPNSINITTEWQRYTFTFNSNSLGMGIQFDNYFGVSPSNQAKDFYIWGAQLVEGSTAKDYQKTETRLNIPRLDYSNGTCPSLLVEPQRTNLLTYSQQISQFYNIGGTFVSNNGISPDGTQNSEKFTVSSFNSFHAGFFENASGATGNSFTTSIFLKKGTGRYFLYRAMTNTYATRYGVTIDLQNGTIVGTNTCGSPTGTSSKIESFSNGWYRVSLTMDGIGVQIGAVWCTSDTATPSLDALLDYSYTGNGSDSYYIWGAQLEAGSYSTSYIPTQGASVTRNADVISKTGISSLIGQTEGTMFVDVYRPNQSSAFLFTLANSVGSNSYLNSIYIFQLPDNKMVVDCFVSGVKQFGIETSVGITNGRHKIAVAYKQNDAVVYLDGVLLGTDTSCNIPPFSAFEVNNVDIGSTSNFDINSVALWKTKLDNATLAQLTTI